MDQENGPSPLVSVHPITDRDLPEVALFLGEHFPPATPADQWADAWRTTVNLPGSTAPNHGFLLRAQGRVVGAYPAIYSTRVINGRLERFCNLAVWFTTPEYRSHSMRMVRAVLGQKDVTFTDLTPIDLVQKLNLRLGFTYLDTATAAVPNVPWFWLARARVSDDPGVIASTLTGHVRTYFADHAECRWARHLVLVRGDQSCYVVWRRRRIKGLPLLASIQYISNPALFRGSFGSLARHLLLHHGTFATLVEDRLAGGRIWPSVKMPRPDRRMFKSTTVGPEDIDYLYSEITSAP
ncbi:hypothetical protein [Salinibacterium sp. ZJ454]|uniref:hypothetical protein n=1 Tax=Salinibacterium sp. ZJ454 TaxID=2708339 RepID=UPI0014242165|nr:hypothetical protein [Salinibacterium sp. ZJ454]